jgi:dynein heavy chain
MNTVLDDNKKLCLNSGQIINLTDQMTMMFEVEDLAVASPATVSRCGMVYMEPGAIGNEPLVKSWLKTCPDTFKKAKKLLPTLEGYFKKYLKDTLKFMRKHCPEPVITVDNNLVQSQMRILDCYFNDYYESEIKKVSQEDVEELEEMLENLFIFSMIWSIGVTTTTAGREKFNTKFRTMIPDKLGFPAEGTIYDYMFDKTKKEWV